MRELVPDFHSFLTFPTDPFGKPIVDAELIDDRIILKNPLCEEINVMYRRLPKKILTDFPNEDIDIPESFSELLGLLCSYFVLLDDDNERADHFKILYNESLKNLKNNKFERIDGGYTDINGWA
jgi:hypothetical protein